VKANREKLQRLKVLNQSNSALITKSEYARRRDVSPAMVSHWIRDGRLVLVGNKVDADRSDEALAKWLDTRRGGRCGGPFRWREGIETGLLNPATVEHLVTIAIRAAVKALIIEMDTLAASPPERTGTNG
jgi:hypothetical protein